MFLKTTSLIFVIYKINFINYDLYILCDIFYSFPVFVLKKYVINLQKKNFLMYLNCHVNGIYSSLKMKWMLMIIISFILNQKCFHIS